MRVTSGPGVPTGDPYLTRQRPQAPSSADERFDMLNSSAVERDFVRQYPKGAGPKSREDLATPRILRLRVKTQRRQEFQKRREGDVGDEVRKSLQPHTSPVLAGEGTACLHYISPCFLLPAFSSPCLCVSVVNFRRVSSFVRAGLVSDGRRPKLALRAERLADLVEHFFVARQRRIDDGA